MKNLSTVFQQHLPGFRQVIDKLSTTSRSSSVPVSLPPFASFSNCLHYNLVMSPFLGIFALKLN